MSVDMEDFGANEQAMDSGNEPAKKGGRKRKLTDAERHENKLESGRKYRRNKAARNQELETKNKILEEENKKLKEENEMKQSEINDLKEKLLKNIDRADNLGREGISFSMSTNMEVCDAKEQAEASGHKKLTVEKGVKQSEMEKSETNSLKEEILEIIARADILVREVSDEVEKAKMVKMVNEALEHGMQQLQHNFLNQKDDFVNLELNNIPMDLEWLNKPENLKDLSENSERLLNESIDSWLNEGTSIGKTKQSPLRETVTVEGFRVPRENSPMIQEIFNTYPNIASGL